MRLTNLMAAAAAMAAFAGAAHAAPYTLTIDSTDPYATPAGEQVVVDFDAPNAAGYAFTPGINVTSGTTPNVAAAPYLVNADTSKYGYVLGGQTSTLTLGAPTTAFSLLWGSVDDYNSLSFYSGGVQVGSTLTGSDILAPANGYQFAGGSALVDFKFAAPIDEVVFSSSQNSFEVDNLAVSAAPEPAGWALMFAGVGILGGALRLRKSRQAAFA